MSIVRASPNSFTLSENSLVNAPFIKFHLLSNSFTCSSIGVVLLSKLNRTMLAHTAPGSVMVFPSYCALISL